MDLSRNVVKQFVSATTPEKETSKDVTVYGTIVVDDKDNLCVKIDGSDVLTPITSNTTVDVKKNDRVLVMIKNHEVMIVGSSTSPSARLDELRQLGKEFTEFGIILADKVGTEELIAIQALIDDLEANDVTINGQLVANEAKVNELTAENVAINGKLDVYQGEFEELKATKLDVEHANITYATIENLEVVDQTVETLRGEYGDFKQLTADNFTLIDGTVKNLEATKLSAEQANIKYASIEVLDVVNQTVEDLSVVNQTVETLRGEYGDFKQLTAENFTLIDGTVKNLEATKLSAEQADIKYATITNLDVVNQTVETLQGEYGRFTDFVTDNFAAVNADILDLDVKKLSAEDADLKYVNIDFGNINQAWFDDFYANSGIIQKVEIGEGVVVKELIGVTIKGDLIEAGTLKVDRLVVLGSDGNYYKLSTDFEGMPGVEPVEEDAIHGSVLIANSVTAEKISVHDLVAFGATIGGFKISDNSIYSRVKESVDNTTRGIYLDNDGQVSIGDKDNYIKFFKDQNGQYKLDISVVDRMEIGGRNLIRNSATMIFEDYSFVDHVPIGNTLLGRMVLGSESARLGAALLGSALIGRMTLGEE